MTTVCLKTFGCSHNLSDSEVMAGFLRDAGYNLIEDELACDIVIINSCAVKTPTENKFFLYLQELKEKGKEVVVAGCIPQALPEKLEGYSLLGTSQLEHIVEVVEETLAGNAVTLIVPEKRPRLNLPKIRRHKYIEIIPINQGCLGKCTFCITKLSRGSLFSYDSKAIVEQATAAVREGVKEIWLTSQDTGCYGLDIGTNIAELLEKMVRIPGDFKIRLGMGNPNYFPEYIDRLLEIFKHPKMFRFMHIPVQAGSNKVLEDMRRDYTVEDYEGLITKIKSVHPDMTIATDVICGFPGETDEEFQETIELVKRTRPDVVNISRYWERPKTRAANRDDKHPTRITKDRSRLISEVFTWEALEVNKRWKGWQGEILIDETGKDGTMVGRNYAYKPVIVQGSYPIGRKLTVKVFGVSAHDLRASVVE